MIPTIYIFVSGGLVQSVRADHPVAVHVIDYDNDEDENGEPIPPANFEVCACGKTIAEIEASTEAVY